MCEPSPTRRGSLYRGLSPERLTKQAQSAAEHASQARRRGHYGAARIWDQVAASCTAALSGAARVRDLGRVELAERVDELGPEGTPGADRGEGKVHHGLAPDLDLVAVVNCQLAYTASLQRHNPAPRFRGDS
jgi:hypothetical protein